MGATYEYRLPLLLRHDASSDRFASASRRCSIRERIQQTALTTPLSRRWPLVLVGATLRRDAARAARRCGPIHVIRSGLARLGRGELDVDVDLPQDSELGDLGDSFKAVTARLAADRTQLAGQRATLESVVEHLEDAVALFGPDGTLLFANPAMRASLRRRPARRSARCCRPAIRTARSSTRRRRTAPARGPQTVPAPAGGERLVLTDVVTDADARPVGVMLVARNLAYLSQVESTISYSRKLAALGRLSAGIAHEVKNPLNATMIHLELLKMQLADQPAAMEHLASSRRRCAASTRSCRASCNSRGPRT